MFSLEKIHKKNKNGESSGVGVAEVELLLGVMEGWAHPLFRDGTNPRFGPKIYVRSRNKKAYNQYFISSTLFLLSLRLWISFFIMIMTLLIKGPLKLFIAEVTISKCQLPPNWHLFKISSEIQRMFSFPCTFIGLAFIALTLQGIKKGKGGGIKCVLRNTFKFIFTQVITSVEKVYKQQSTVVPFETWTLCWWKPQGLEITPLPELEPSGQIPPNWVCLRD